MNRQAQWLALALFLVSVAVFFLYVKRFDEEESGGERVALLVAAKGIPRGRVIAEDMLTVKSVPLAYVEDRSVKAGEKDRVVGRPVMNTLEEQQALMWTDFLGNSEHPRDLSSMVAPGYRAVYVRAMREDQGSSLILPGDSVDVLATLPVAADSRDGKATVVLLQKILVLANGVKTSAEPAVRDPDEKQARPSTSDSGLTLSLSLQQAQTVAVAALRGTLSIALRNPTDATVSPATMEVRQTTLTDPAARAAIQSIKYMAAPALHASGR